MKISNNLFPQVRIEPTTVAFTLKHYATVPSGLKKDHLIFFYNNSREHGSDMEKEFYKDITILQLIDRILKDRAISFVGPRDKYRLITGEKG